MPSTLEYFLVLLLPSYTWWFSLRPVTFSSSPLLVQRPCASPPKDQERRTDNPPGRKVMATAEYQSLPLHPLLILLILWDTPSLPCSTISSAEDSGGIGGRRGGGGGVSDNSDKYEDDSSGVLSYLSGVGCICYHSLFPPRSPLHTSYLVPDYKYQGNWKVWWIWQVVTPPLPLSISWGVEVRLLPSRHHCYHCHHFRLTTPRLKLQHWSPPPTLWRRQQGKERW